MRYRLWLLVRSDYKKLGLFGYVPCNIRWVFSRHRPSSSDEPHNRSGDLFRARVDQIIRSDHPLVRRADAMLWESIVEQVADLLLSTREGAGEHRYQYTLVVFWRRILSAVLPLLDQSALDARSNPKAAAA